MSEISINIKKKNYNINLALLRVYLSFIVVNSHCLKRGNILNKYILKLLVNRIHVPIFFIISFYFNHNLLISKNIKKIKQRFERILIPYLIWPIIIWIINNLISFFQKREMKNSLNDLKLQLLTGHIFMEVLWFQYNLIFITLFILIIKLIFIHNTILILINLWNIVYFLQFSNINFNIFINYKYYIQYNFGRLIEILPYCITGYILSSIKLIDKLKKYRAKSISTIFLILFFIIKCNIFININGFVYQGIYLHIVSVSIFLIISIISIKKIDNNMFCIKIIKIITNHTSGIYYLHIPIKNYLHNYIELIKNETLFGCVIIYLFCYFISSAGLIIFKNTKLRHLFQ